VKADDESELYAGQEDGIEFDHYTLPKKKANLVSVERIVAATG
jgi:hypothetical protein